MIKEQIQASRDIKPSSLRTYLSTLKSLSKQLGNDKFDDLTIFQQYDNVIKAIVDRPITSKKNVLTAILVVLKSQNDVSDNIIELYSNELKKLNDEYNTFLQEQSKTPKQAENWITVEEYKETIDKIHHQVKALKLQNESVIDDNDMMLLQSLVILMVYLHFPIRNNFSDMKIINSREVKRIDKTDNYLVIQGNKKYFDLNDFKNVDRIGPKILKVPTVLNKLINLWLKFNTTGYFLINKNHSPMSPNSITKFLNKIFQKYLNKTVSTSMIRHVMISDKLEGMPTIKEEQQRAKDIENTFLHSKPINDIYRKV